MIPSRLVLATANPGKVAELGALANEWGSVEVLGLERFPGVVCPPEDGTAYEENAALKARAVAAATDLPALADDSGLEVDALDGAPGVRSARWAGPTDADRVRALLAALASVPDDRRGARFVCVVALAWADGRLLTASGTVSGRIARLPDGAGGFGYDPVFVADELGRTFAAASNVEKSRVSHRARAMRALGRQLSTFPTLRRPARPC